jgi:hypothetical protein
MKWLTLQEENCIIEKLNETIRIEPFAGHRVLRLCRDIPSCRYPAGCTVGTFTTFTGVHVYGTIHNRQTSENIVFCVEQPSLSRPFHLEAVRGHVAEGRTGFLLSTKNKKRTFSLSIGDSADCCNKIVHKARLRILRKAERSRYVRPQPGRSGIPELPISLIFYA